MYKLKNAAKTCTKTNMATFKCYTNHRKPVISDIVRMHLPIHIRGAFT